MLVTSLLVTDLLLVFASENQNNRSLKTEYPFLFGKVAEGHFLTDRTEDAKRLTANLTHGINTILIYD